MCVKNITRENTTKNLMSRSKVLAKEKFMCKYIRTSLAKKNSFPENFAFCEIFWIEFSRNQICCSLHKKKNFPVRTGRTVRDQRLSYIIRCKEEEILECRLYSGPTTTYCTWRILGSRGSFLRLLLFIGRILLISLGFRTKQKI